MKHPRNLCDIEVGTQLPHNKCSDAMECSDGPGWRLFHEVYRAEGRGQEEAVDFCVSLIIEDQ